ARPDLRYSLSVSGDRAFVRMGTQGLGPVIYQTINGKVVTVQGKPVVIPDESNSFLVCLSLKPGAKRREEWSASAKLLPLDAPQRFEGAPLVHDGRVYIVHSRFESDRTVSAIVCYPMDRGKELWRREVCDTKTAPVHSLEERRLRHYLLTLAGGNVVYCSHSGAIVAVDAASGKRAWAVRYPSRGLETEDGDPSPRDLAPCVYA